MTTIQTPARVREQAWDALIKLRANVADSRAKLASHIEQRDAARKEIDGMGNDATPRRMRKDHELVEALKAIDFERLRVKWLRNQMDKVVQHGDQGNLFESDIPVDCDAETLFNQDDDAPAQKPASSVEAKPADGGLGGSGNLPIAELLKHDVSDRAVMVLKREGMLTLGAVANWGKRLTLISGITPNDEQSIDEAIRAIIAGAKDGAEVQARLDGREPPAAAKTVVTGAASPEPDPKRSKRAASRAANKAVRSAAKKPPAKPLKPKKTRPDGRPVGVPG